MGVAVRRFHFEHAVADFEDGDIERAAAEVVHSDGLVGVALVKSVCESGRCRLVHDTLDVKSGDTSGVFRRLTLTVVEVSRNGDDRFGDLLAEEGLRIVFQFLKNHGGDFRRRVVFSARNDFDVAVLGFREFVGNALCIVLRFSELASHETLDREDCVLRVRHGLTFCGLTDQTLSGLCECDD